MQTFNRILYVVDPSLERRWALERACAFAADVQASLTLLLVAEPIPAAGGFSQEQIDQAIRHECDARLDALLASLDTPAVIVRKVVFGRLHIEVIREVMRGSHDLVIKAAEGERGIRDLVLGSRDMHLLRKCPCPVWLLKPAGTERYQRILAAVDLMPGADDTETGALNRLILEWASSLALTEFAELHVAHAWDAPATGLLRRWGAGVWAQDTAVEEYRYVEETRDQRLGELNALLNELSESLGSPGFEYLAARSHLPRGAATEAIPALASELAIDLLVMGTLGRGGIPGLLIGNTAETILSRCDCAVLAIKPPGFVSPVSVES